MSSTFCFVIVRTKLQGHFDGVAQSFPVRPLPAGSNNRATSNLKRRLRMVTSEPEAVYLLPFA
jgi:hypothetical protein